MLVDSFHDLARRIELGEVWREKNLDKNTDSDGIIKKNGVRNGGTDNDYDGERQEDLRGTKREVQGRPVGNGLNRSSSQERQSEVLGSQSSVRASLLTEQQTEDFESINPTIHVGEWQDASSDLEGFSNALNAAREASLYGAFVDSQSPEGLKGAKVAMTTDGLAGCAVQEDGNITAVFKHPSKKTSQAVGSIITMARALGGTKMDCFGKGLLNMYKKLGFEVVGRNILLTSISRKTPTALLSITRSKSC